VVHVVEKPFRENIECNDVRLCGAGGYNPRDVNVIHHLAGKGCTNGTNTERLKGHVDVD
jgi:hypothetical protein